MNFDDLDAADYILNRIRNKFKHFKGYGKTVTVARNKVDGLRAYRAKSYDTAFDLLGQSDDHTVIQVTQALIHLRILKCKELVAEGKYSQALGLIEMNLKQVPERPEFLYAAGVIAYFSQDDSRETSLKFKSYLKKFISQNPTHPYAEVARHILENRENLSVPLGI